MANVTELFSPPDELLPVLQRPFGEWSDADYGLVFQWLHDEPRRAYLHGLTLRVAPVYDISPEVAYGLVEHFYSRPLRRLLRRAHHKNFGALLLVEFEKFLLRAAYRQGIGHVDHAVARSSNQIFAEIPLAKRNRLSPLQKLMALWRPSPPEPPATPASDEEGDWVETSVFGPRRIAQERHFMIQAFTHTREESEEARRLAGEFDDEAERLGVRSLGVRLLPATRLTYTLRVPGLRIVEPIQEMHWQRKTENVAWGVEVPASYRLGSVIGTVTVAADGIPLGRITFKLDILPIGKGKTVKMDALDPVATGAEKFKHAFISYASQDPVIVEGPPPVPPPPELAHLHFNDPLIYFREPLRSS